jgi:hypothetical protein
MSVHLVTTTGDFARDHIGPACGACFVCGKEVQHIAVVWQGSAISHAGVIAMHPQCAQGLGLHLVKDGLLGEHIERGNGALIGVDRALWPKAAL